MFRTAHHVGRDSVFFGTDLRNSTCLPNFIQHCFKRVLGDGGWCKIQVGRSHSPIFIIFWLYYPFFVLFSQNDGMRVFILCQLTIKRTMMGHGISTPEFFYPRRMESEAWALGSRMKTNAQVTSSQTDVTHAYVMSAQSRNLWNLFFLIVLAENHDNRNLKCLTGPSPLTP